MIWDCNVQRVINKFDNHTEFVVGLDFNLLLRSNWQVAAGTNHVQYSDMMTTLSFLWESEVTCLIKLLLCINYNICIIISP